MTQLLLTVAGLTIAGLLSPGPNFVMITGRALSSGTRAAVAAAVGVALGSMTHAALGILGFGALLQSSAVLFFAAKLVGAAYLCWVGSKSLLSAARARRSSAPPSHDAVAELSARAPARSAIDGYLTQMSNPKSTLFFLALFTTVVPADTSATESVLVVATVVTLALVGYVTIAVAFSRPIMQRGYRRAGHIFDAVFGVVMIGLGLRVAAAAR